MKLYYTPGACPLAVHIVLCELNLPHELVKVDLKTKQLEDGSDYNKINPKGYVPTLELDDGTRITELPAIVQHLADTHPEGGLIAATGSLQRTRAVEWLTFAGMELHRNFSPMFNPAASQDWKDAALAKLKQRFEYLNGELKGKDYILGSNFCVADSYLFTTTHWTYAMKIDISHLPHLVAYHQRVLQRPAVQSALKAQGLI